MKVKKYLKPEKDVDGRGPHKSLCTSSKGTEACQEACLSKLTRWCFLSTQLEQTPSLHDTIERPVIILSLHSCCNEHNLSENITHAKVCSSYHYEQQKLKEKVMTQRC